MRVRPVRISAIGVLSLLSILTLLLNGCTFSLLNIPLLNGSTTTPIQPAGPTAAPQPSAAVTFRVSLPSPLLAGETLYLTVVDEVTGLDLNYINYAMQGIDTLDYTVTIPFTLDSVVKYRYVRQAGLPIVEADPFNTQVRYRMYQVVSPGTVNDVIASWTDSPFTGSFGQISGHVVDSTSNIPIPDILILVDGQQTLTDSNGVFVFDAVPVGTHNLVAYAMDGSYQTFQQGARVDASLNTPVAISLTPATLVNVIFNLTPPANTIQNVPIRLAGNLYQLGNTFGDLQGGLSTVASRMPVLALGQDGRYSLSLMLPAGADIRYKYTLGDGFWNTEHNPDGSFIVRQLIVPASSTPVEVQDVAPTWQSGSSSPILFEVTVPTSTPSTDLVSIQFNPYGWTEPIPMWPRGNNQWVYQLYSPLNMLGNFEYRYCRNEQCGIADDSMTSGTNGGRLVSTSLTPQDFQDTVTSWTWLENSTPSSVVGVPVTARSGFTAGVEFMPGYNPTWQSWFPLAIQNVQGIYANLLVLTPTWTVERSSPFIFSPLPGMDPLWADTLDIVNQARASNLNVALFPEPNLQTDLSTWWVSTPRDATFWNAWFNRYAAFAAYHADLAMKSGAQVLILGGDWVTPALPGGQIGGSSSGVPADAVTRWQAILADVRSRFSGSIYWALSYPGGLSTAPDFLKTLDGVYLLWNAPLSGSNLETMTSSAGQLLDTDIQPFQASLQKPVILAVAYPSADGTANATLPSSVLFQPGSTQAPVNLQAQADVYQAMLTAVNGRAWVGGFISRGYYPPAILLDASASIHGKPASDELWYWFPRFLGITQ
jgi:hypothetical protein